MVSQRNVDGLLDRDSGTHVGNGGALHAVRQRHGESEAKVDRKRLRQTILVALVQVHNGLGGILVLLPCAPGTNGHDSIEAGATEESILSTGVSGERMRRLNVGVLSVSLDVIEGGHVTEMEVIHAPDLRPTQLVAEGALAAAGSAFLQVETEGAEKNGATNIVATGHNRSIGLNRAISAVLEFELDRTLGLVVVQLLGLPTVFNSELLGVHGKLQLGARGMTLSLEHGL